MTLAAPSPPRPPSPAAYLALVRAAARRREEALQRVILRVARRYRAQRADAAPSAWQLLARDSTTLSPAQAIALGADLRVAVAAALASGEIPSYPGADAYAEIAGRTAPAAVGAELRMLAEAGMPPQVRAAIMGGTSSPGAPPNPADPNQVAAVMSLGGEAAKLAGARASAPQFRINVMSSPVVANAINGWANTSASLITSLEADDLANIPARIQTAVVSGQRWEVVARELAESGNVSKHRAELIARDQVARLNGQITQNMQTAAGVTEYNWVTAGDMRVRKTHIEASQGGPYKWGDPNQGAGAPNVGFNGERGHPGQAGQCRCRARPVLPDWWRTIQLRARADAAGARNEAFSRVAVACGCQRR